MGELCRECHRLAPFCFYNGNTFSAAARGSISALLARMPSITGAALRSVLGHYIAGVASVDELKAAIEAADAAWTAANPGATPTP